MCVASTSEACAPRLGLPVRKGSVSSLVSPSLSAKQDWPRNRMSMWSPLSSVLVGVQLELTCQFPPDGHANQHAHAGFLGEQGPNGRDALVVALLAGRLADLLILGVAEPAAAHQRLVED